MNWILTKDSKGNTVNINTNPVYIHKHNFDVQQHLKELYELNTKQSKLIA